ncbi:PLDc N-terminal domain-containing protein [Ornithinicoccus halotolerans]|uniref:PLDc N-terminal domain-containing protein n=1 Tax=Ornithinicoccus halotolerans TaxID=1748220 RepID=UPI00129497D0|nr:PLDc N-terminal domain-containing protein [Ornithinicoccus halotolerans]
MLRVAIVALVLVFTVYCVVDAVRTEQDAVRHLPKLVWVAITVLFPLVGGIAWLLAGRPRQHRVPPPPGPRGPDDDPDFLRGL